MIFIGPMDEFLEELKSGEIKFRDRWQFELKSEFSPQGKESQYVQEFYFFIPNSLQIYSDTYSKIEFYRDLTNIIRYKTPYVPFDVLCNMQNESSPLFNLKKDTVSLKLLGNIFKSSLRQEIRKILNFSNPPEEEVYTLCRQIREFRSSLKQIEAKLDLEANKELKVTFAYFDEFIGNSIDYYLTGLLDQFQTHNSPVPKKIEDELCDIILEEAKINEKEHHASMRITKAEDSSRNEQILYRVGLLKAYFLDALSLYVDRTSVQEQYGNYISAFSAGLAMSVYLLLFIWQGQWFVINSLPFVVITVAAYILKDRMKESLKSLSYQRAFRYFSDYRTKIRSPQNKVIGELRESFTFVDESKIPDDIRKVRNFQFHSMLKTFKRPEQIIYFKRIITTYAANDPYPKALNISLRYNIQDFLEKASEPFHTYSTLDETTRTLLKLRLPKVYHLNTILKNQFAGHTEILKYRIIVDKNGIKNIEKVNG